MHKTLYQYAIVRFQPFMETEEFGNVGVIAMSTQDRFFGFKLATNRYARITNFFEEINKASYLSALYGVKEELQRCNEVFKLHGFDRRRSTVETDYVNFLFSEITKPRETIIQFSRPRKILVEDGRKVVDDLFGHYVERNFISKKSPEQKLESRVRKSLVAADLASQFERVTIGRDAYQVTFPFVERRENEPYKIIKPLHLAHKAPHMILDHSAQWHFRVMELKRRSELPQRVMFTVEGPKKADYMRADFSDANTMFNDAVEMLRRNNVEVINDNEIDKLVEFAS